MSPGLGGVAKATAKGTGKAASKSSAKSLRAEVMADAKKELISQAQNVVGGQQANSKELKQVESELHALEKRYANFSHDELHTMREELNSSIKSYQMEIAKHGGDETYEKLLSEKNKGLQDLEKYMAKAVTPNKGAQAGLAKKAAGLFGGKKASKADELNAMQTLNSQESQDNQRQLAEEKAEKDERIARANQELQEQISEIKADFDQKIEEEKSGRPLPFPVSFFATTFYFIAIAVVDSLLAAVPIAGDFLGFAFVLLAWGIPSILIFSVGAFIAILKFMIFDLVFGLVAGSLGNVIPVVGDMVLDAVPEVLILVAFFLFRKKVNK